MRLGSEFDTDSNTFPSFDVETESRHSDHSIRFIFEFEELNNLLDVGVLLRFGNVTRLPEVSTESEGFPNGSGRLVSIELFDLVLSKKKTRF